MPNERDVRQGGSRAICSITGRHCRCESGRRGCIGRVEGSLPEVSETQRLLLLAARSYIEGAVAVLRKADNTTRAFPGPEIRGVAQDLLVSVGRIGEILAP